jgi:hypothetical protein
LRRLSVAENIPVAGVALNMAYMSIGDRRSFPFGKPDATALGQKLGSRILTEIPMEPMVSAKGLGWTLDHRADFSRAFSTLTDRVVEQPWEDGVGRQSSQPRV